MNRFSRVNFMQIGRGSGHMGDQMGVVIITGFAHMANVAYPDGFAALTIVGFRIVR